MKEISKERYKEMTDMAVPNSASVRNCVKAFMVGGAICALGQFLLNLAEALGAGKEEAAAITSISLIFIAVLLTGLGVYDKIGKFAGAGTLVPITGFANSVAAPSIEFRKEGWVFGIGANMFAIAGPVILYGTMTSFVVGIVYYFLR